MSAKMSPARKAAFLAGLRATGNLTLAAERAKASFDKLRMSGRKSMKPPPCWSSQSGEELVVTGSARGPRRIARARLDQWTPRLEARFCAALAGCGNVKHALRAVGLSPAAAYNHRKRWPDFAARWSAALAAGRVAAERSLVTGAIALLDPEVDPPEGLEPMSVAQAITVARITRRRGALEPRERWIRCDRCRKRVGEG